MHLREEFFRNAEDRQQEGALLLDAAVRRRFLQTSHLNTPVSNMRTLPGLLGAYWVSEDWKSVWALTAGIAVMTAAMSKSSVYIAENAANFMSAIFHNAPGSAPGPGPALLSSIGLLAAAIAGRTAIEAGRHYLSTTLHRKWRGWLNEQFTNAVLKDRHYLHLTHDQDYDRNDPNAMPDNIDQRILESPKAITGGAIGLAMGIFGVATSIYFIGERLVQNSTPVHGLEFLGAYASVALAFGAAAAYVPLNTFIAVKLGKQMEKLTIMMQQAEATLRGEVNYFFHSAPQVAAARGEKVQQKIYKDLYSDVDNVWRRQNYLSAGFLGFNNLQNSMQNKLVSYLPALPSLAQGSMMINGYLASSELVSALINDCSWLIHVMPDVANLRAHSKRLTQVAEAVEKVHNTREYYSKTGVTEFNFHPDENTGSVSAKNIELYHKGQDKPFLKAGDLTFERGKWAAVMGASGSGKSTLVKALVNLWPYGKGDIRFPKDSRLIFASQEPFLPRTSLKQNICLPRDEGKFDDAKIAEVLKEVGLGDFVEFANDELYKGKAWNNVLSGGQKQLVVLARILLHKPDILVMDEATSALDEKTKKQFHRLLEKHCPDMIAVSIIHDKALVMPDAEGEMHYSSLVEIANGEATQLFFHPAPLPMKPKQLPPPTLNSHP